MANEILEYVSALDGSQMDIALMDMARHTSEAWAIGERNGLPVGTSDETYENNAKYYAEQAARVIPKTGTAAVRYDVPQALTDTEKAQARANIGTPNPTELLDLKMLGWTVPHDFAVQNYEENGVYHQRVGRVDLGGFNWYASGGYEYLTEGIVPTLMKYPEANDLPVNAYLSGYTVATYVARGTDKTIFTSWTTAVHKYFYIRDSRYTTVDELKSALRGKYLYFELATEITRPIDGGEWVAKYSNPNLIDNPFPYQINQRGVTTKRGGYSVDRWKAYFSDNITLTVKEKSIRLTKNAGDGYAAIIQMIDDKSLLGKLCTFSMRLADGRIFSTTKTYSPNNNTNVERIVQIDNRPVTMAMWTVGGYPVVGLYCSAAYAMDIEIECFKLEEGAVCTIHNEREPNCATELLKCQRYLRVFPNGTYVNGIAQTADIGNVIIHLPVPMRSTPTFTASGLQIFYGPWTSIATLPTVSGDLQVVNLSFRGLSLTIGRGYLFRLENAVLSAEL